MEFCRKVFGCTTKKFEELSNRSNDIPFEVIRGIFLAGILESILIKNIHNQVYRWFLNWKGKVRLGFRDNPSLNFKQKILLRYIEKKITLSNDTSFFKTKYIYLQHKTREATSFFLDFWENRCRLLVFCHLFGSLIQNLQVRARPPN